MSAMENTIQEKVEFVYSPARDEEWMFLRESLQDPALMEAPREVFIANMRAAYLQLVTGAMLKAMGGLGALRSRVPEVAHNYEVFADAIKGRDPEIERLKGLYNQAYGSSSNGIHALVPEFNRHTTSGRMSARSQRVLAEHLTSVAYSMLGEFERADGGGIFQSRKSVGQRAVGSPAQGAGCMLMILGSIFTITFSIFVKMKY